MKRLLPQGGGGTATELTNTVCTQLLLWYPVFRGRGYAGFQVTGMRECGQKSSLPTPRKKSIGFLTKPKKTQDTLETPKNIFCFINNIMQNDNFRMFWVLKKSPRKSKFSYSKKYRNRKFQTQKDPWMIPVTWNPVYHPRCSVKFFKASISSLDNIWNLQKISTAKNPK